METETKICQNCQKELTIEPEDFAFYEKIKVPLPTWCPECRIKRRLMWRNEGILYKRKCDICRKSIIAIYPSDSFYKVYCNECWYSDKWDPFVYGRQYNFKQPFFVQFKELLKNIPLFSKLAYNNINSEYVNWSANNKDCYLSFSAVDCEEVSYCRWITKSKNSLDCFMVIGSELLYECFNCKRCYHSIFLLNSRDCIDSMFLFNCINCQNCFMSSNIRHKKFYFFNKSCSKEEYFKKLGEMKFGDYKTLEVLKKRFNEMKKHSFHKFAFLDKCINVIGDNIFSSTDSKYVFFGDNLEDVKFTLRSFDLKDSMDSIGTAGELIYEVQAAGLPPNYLLKFVSMNISPSNSFYDYCVGCGSSSHLFGCVGLRNKEYCVLNKQYAKEEYEALVPKIIEHMNKMPYISKSQIPMTNDQSNPNAQSPKTKEIIYRYGEFFPPELSPFSYNETIAQEYFPLTKEQAIEQGYRWKDREERNLQIDLKTEDLPDHIKDVKDDIVGKVIECANARSLRGMDPRKAYGGPSPGEFSNCTTAFKLISQELAFYRRMNLPLPRLCPNCRHYQRLKQRNPLKLWRRQCMCAGKTSKADGRRMSVDGHATSEHCYINTIEHFHGDKPCPQEFETTYAPDRPEIVYCEECYKREVN